MLKFIFKPNFFILQIGLKIMTKTKVLSGKTAGNGVEVVVQPVAVKQLSIKTNYLFLNIGRQRTNINRRCFVNFNW